MYPYEAKIGDLCYLPRDGERAFLSRVRSIANARIETVTLVDAHDANYSVGTIFKGNGFVVIPESNQTYHHTYFANEVPTEFATKVGDVWISTLETE